VDEGLRAAQKLDSFRFASFLGNAYNTLIYIIYCVAIRWRGG